MPVEGAIPCIAGSEMFGNSIPEGTVCTLAVPGRSANALSTFFGRNAAYGAMMMTRPQTIGYALTDSPSALAAFTYEKIAISISFHIGC
jgi:hypothetical protein